MATTWPPARATVLQSRPAPTTGRTSCRIVALVAQVATEHRGEFVQHHDLVLGQDDEVGAGSGDIADDRQDRRDVRHQRELRVGRRGLVDDLLRRGGPKCRQRATERRRALRVALHDIGAQPIDRVTIIGTRAFEADDGNRGRFEAQCLGDA